MATPHGQARPSRRGAPRQPAAATARGGDPVRLLPDRAGARLPLGDGGPLRRRWLPRAGTRHRLAAPAGAAGGRRGADAAAAHPGRRRRRQRDQRRARLAALPLHQRRPQRPPRADAGGGVGLRRRGDAAAPGRRRHRRVGALRRAGPDRPRRADPADRRTRLTGPPGLRRRRTFCRGLAAD